MPEPTTPTSLLIAPLPQLAVLRFDGADATDFLQGQLTQDLKTLAPNEARLAAYCTAKGRMLATLVIWRVHGAEPATYEALVSADLADALAKRLRMFVLRAKVGITRSPRAVAGAWRLAEAPGLPAAWQVADDADGVTWIGAPAAPQAAARGWRIGAADAPAVGEAAADAWLAQQIEAGLPWVDTAVQELLTPQMANLDLIGGVSFTKGCYPGQEVVARAHYRGKQKRRALLGRAAPDAGAAPAQDVYDARQPGGEPIGRVINAAATAQATVLLFEAPFEAAQTAQLRLGTPDGPAIALEPLPYALDPA
ncbi:folate-binding protein YgfZ [Verticiella sediminum]|uniref:Folate-binding protein YgfZ n=1 Tax=Verticiella sediminum TaxID=1247510 RepID=A0A556AY64_9BURK|nr:folate-binding protein YgfZ [Verticiella sediminum]TSH97869.1 folate-binding protein YgfZ [Verticiella sediminum]